MPASTSLLSQTTKVVMGWPAFVAPIAFRSVTELRPLDLCRSERRTDLSSDVAATANDRLVHGVDYHPEAFRVLERPIASGRRGDHVHVTDVGVQSPETHLRSPGQVVSVQSMAQ
jgi:hypothetical protein